MFSDRLRILKVAVPLAVVVGLCVYSHREGTRRFFSLDKLIDSPRDYVGGQITCTYQRIVEAPGTGRLKSYFKLDDGRGNLIRVRLRRPTRMSKGDWISFTARVVGPRALVPTEYRLHKGRYVKYVVGAAVLVLIAVYLARTLRITRAGIGLATGD